MRALAIRDRLLVIDRMVADAKVLMADGIGLAAICSNDAKAYAADSFPNMQRFAKGWGLGPCPLGARELTVTFL